MPKLKTHKATAKRIKKTATGKLMRRHSFQNHFLRKKSSARKRAFTKDHPLNAADAKQVKRLLGE